MGSLYQETACLGLLPRCQWLRLLLLKIEIQFQLNKLSLFWPIDFKLGVWVAYIKWQLGIATQVSLLKIEIKFLLNNLSLLWPIDTKLGVL
jgi:hypothetical protein